MECPQCGATNKETDVHCYRCGLPLTTVVSTRVFNQKDETPVIPKRRWGTARFDSKTAVIFNIRGHSKPLRVIFEKPDMVIGRSHGDSSPEVDLNPYGGLDAGVSRRHALLRQQNDTIVLIDLGSANHTYLNGQHIIPNEPRILRDGDELRLGRLVMRATFEDVTPFEPKAKE